MAEDNIPGHYINVNGHNIFGYSRYIDLYREMVMSAEDGAHFVELGSFLGQSTAAMGAYIKASGKRIQFDAVDIFELSDFSDSIHAKAIEDHGGDFLAAFKSNLEKSQVTDAVTIVKATSLEAADMYEDRSISFIMIDASHKYQDVIDDIEAWFPKLKLGGVMSGDDLDWEEVKNAVQDTCKHYGVYQNSTWYFRKQTPTLEEHRALSN
jgi:predicted O-methyltransferase YrrM